MIARGAVRYRPSFSYQPSLHNQHIFQRFLRRVTTNGATGAQGRTVASELVTEATVPPGLSVSQLPSYWLENSTRYSDTRFKHGICDHQTPRLTLREVAMLRLMDAITDKANWYLKIFDETIVTRWRYEAQATPNGLISDQAFEWCVKELRDRVEEFKEDGFVKTLESDSRCVKSDDFIPTAHGDRLRRAVKPLLEVSDDQKDWHLNSDGKVLNLIHPSLYPLVVGHSKILPTGQIGVDDCLDNMGQGVLVPQGEKVRSHLVHGLSYHINQDKLCSTRFQWLPSEIQFVGEGTDEKIASYINNLHPNKHKELYSIIEQLIGKSIPLWNNVLQSEQGLLRLAPTVKTYIAQPDNPLYTARREHRSCPALPSDPKEWVDHEVHEAVREVYERTRTIIHPEPTPSCYAQWKAKPPPRIRLEEDFKAEGLQVIVKLSSIELTPEKPDYPDGTWHLEGMLNESIVATSIYYYDVENATPSQIRFSQVNSVDGIYWDVSYEQGDHEPLAIVFGSRDMDDAPAVQKIGTVATKHGRVIALPNDAVESNMDSYNLCEH
ncbi:hypothetical protein BU23DRAFT_657381 [Bimuria novae-zelandiae CBS 107.79]|uniref:Uncharacterized protein n=1 Tax=Bimuria novae-zelandiae CBS 107.79 TaxID=1447943 RepID=A0A6A5VXI9_9PLEO|nr:hypothetical protein BU23DRAFT_657381 [Bimuria novae-zelandiae CBS 107.79]